MSFVTAEVFEQIKSRIKNGIRKRNLDIIKILRILGTEKEKDYIEDLNKSIQDFEFFTDIEKFNVYGNIFGIASNYLDNYKTRTNSSNYKFSEEFLEKLLDQFLYIIINEKFCSECYSVQIEIFPKSVSKSTYMCKNCLKRVFISQRGQHLPTFLLYVKERISKSFSKKIDGEPINPYKEFIEHLLIDSFEHFSEKHMISSIKLFYEVLKDNKIKIELITNRIKFKELLINTLKQSLKKQDLYSFIEGNEYFKINDFGSLIEEVKEIQGLLVTFLLKSLKKGSAVKVEEALSYFQKEDLIEMPTLLAKKGFREEFEAAFYAGLSRNLKRRNSFKSFEELIKFSTELNIFIDVKKIPYRFENLLKITRDLLQSVMYAGFDSLGEIIEVVRFYNNYNLFERDFTSEELQFLENMKIDKFLVNNLEDLFGKVSNSLIYFGFHEMPSRVYEFFEDVLSTSSYSFDDMIRGLNNYAIYGLSVQHIGSIKEFYREFEVAYDFFDKSAKLIEFTYFNDREQPSYYTPYNTTKKHLASPENLIKVKEKLKEKDDYSFYSMSMVLLGGLGPQGHGFTYSTPRGEVVEICSDRRENEAIIVKYKQFLKQQFLYRLERELVNLQIKPENNRKIIAFLSDIIYNKELINYYKKEPIVKKIKKYFSEEQGSQLIGSVEFQEFIEKISNAMDIILRPIDMIDQFKCRMDLIAEGKIESKDIAKLTSLKEKSHYDVLRERFFYQHIIKLVSEIHFSKTVRFFRT